MAKVSKETASDVRKFGPVTDRREEMAGYTVEFVSFAADSNLDGPLQALPAGMCQCPHWGYVITGRVTFRFGDRDEVYEAGDAFYTPPGHIPVKHEPGSEIVMFSPADELRETEAVMMKNMQAMQSP